MKKVTVILVVGVIAAPVVWLWYEYHEPERRQRHEMTARYKGR